MSRINERFSMEEEKLQEVAHIVQEEHPEASDEDVSVILLDGLATDAYQDWLDEAGVEEIVDWTRQNLEKTY